jgi:hypothetical protein
LVRQRLDIGDSTSSFRYPRKAANMGSRYQTVIVVIVFAVIIGGVTFAQQWLSPPLPPEPPQPPKPDRPKPHLTLLVPQEMPEGQSWTPAFEFEMWPTQGHYDFWFQNENDQPVLTGVDSLSCSKCVFVNIRLLSPEESVKFREWLPKAAVAQFGGIPGFLDLAASAAATFQETRSFLSEDDSWSYLKSGDDKVGTFTIPPKACGLIRLGWQGLKAGKEMAKAVLWTELPGKTEPRGRVSLEMPLMFVAPIIVYPSKAKVELGPGEQQKLDIWCWSDTNAGFQLQAREKESHPCFTCSCLPMSRTELLELGAKMRGPTGPHPLFGYHVVVTMVERLPQGPQLDLGDFDREILLTSPDLEFSPGKNELGVGLKGKVHGDLTVGLLPEQDKVDLGMYQLSRGTAKEIPLKSLRAGLRLKTLSHNPSFLEVNLEEVGKPGLDGRRWKLKVRVPPNHDRLPEDGVIVLETNDQPPRKVRIPVTGLGVRSPRPGNPGLGIRD